MAAWLEKGEDIYEIAVPVTTLGRDDTNNIALSIDLVSRVHAIIYERNGNYFIRDLGSLNGTRVNGQAITEDMPLREGDVVTAGFDLTFKTGELPIKDQRRQKRPDEAYQRRTQAFHGSDFSKD